MDREILFKAKRKDNGEWVEGFVFEFKDKFYITKMTQTFMTAYYSEESVVNFNMRAVEIDPDTLCQFTGLTDKNRKKIWENDIVSIDEDYCFDGRSVVKFGRYKDIDVLDIHKCRHIGFYLDHISQLDQSRRQDIIFFCPKCKVVGNVFDNPELLN